MDTQTLGVAAGGPPGGAEPERVGARIAESHWRAVARVLRSPFRVMGGVLGDVVATVLPGDCRVCGEALLRVDAVPVCDECLARIRPKTGPDCGCCGDAIDLGIDLEDVRFSGMLAEGLLCRECRMARPAYERAVAYGLYADELREMIHLLKYEQVRGVADKVAGALAHTMLTLRAESSQLEQATLVVAVPLFPAAERRRGYNQARVLADKALAELRRTNPAWKLKAAHGVLVRQKSTDHQFALSRRARRRNLRGAFAVRGEVRGREVLLVDDILTTGATARECARVLVKAGAAKVLVATLARAQSERITAQQRDPGAYVAGWDLPPAAT